MNQQVDILLAFLHDDSLCSTLFTTKPFVHMYSREQKKWSKYRRHTYSYNIGVPYNRQQLESLHCLELLRSPIYFMERSMYLSLCCCMLYDDDIGVHIATQYSNKMCTNRRAQPLTAVRCPPKKIDPRILKALF